MSKVRWFRIVQGVNCSVIQHVDGPGCQWYRVVQWFWVVELFRMCMVQTATQLSTNSRTVIDGPAMVFRVVVLVVIPVVFPVMSPAVVVFVLSSSAVSSGGGSQWLVVPVMVLCCRFSYPLLQL